MIYLKVSFVSCLHFLISCIVIIQQKYLISLNVFLASLRLVNAYSLLNKTLNHIKKEEVRERMHNLPWIFEFCVKYNCHKGRKVAPCFTYLIKALDDGVWWLNSPEA